MSKAISDKILTGETPSLKVYEDDYVYAFLDTSQATRGHTLLIPKKASVGIFETGEETMEHIGAVLPKVVNAIKCTSNPDGLSTIQNNGEFADQFISYIHSRLIPWYENDIDGFGHKWEVHEGILDNDVKQ